jgi:hypothetical protein
VSRATGVHDWSGDVRRVEAYFEPDRLADLERRLNLSAGGLVPQNVVVFVCGLTGTIGAVLVRLVERAFVPHAKVIREALGVSPEMGDSLFYELYDPTPVINVDDPVVIAPLRARMLAALARR